MKILLDECVPHPFKSFLSAQHECTTVPEAGLAGLANGELLGSAAEFFEVFITLDKGIQYQQNIAGQSIAIVLIQARSNRLADLVVLVPAQLVAIGL
jgi:hypothetical protein